MIRFLWVADKYFAGSIGGEVEAVCKAAALEKAKAVIEKHPDAIVSTLRLTHQKSPNNKKWKTV